LLLTETNFWEREGPMFEDLYWLYMAYNITKHHGPTWGSRELDYLEILSSNTEALENTGGDRH